MIRNYTIEELSAMRDDGYKPANKDIYMFSLDPSDTINRGKAWANEVFDKQYKANIKGAEIKALAEFENKMDALIYALTSNQTATWAACYVEINRISDFYNNQFKKIING